jgi:hypothetical protein
MAEAQNSVQLTKLHTSMSLATNTLALQRAMKAAKAKLQAQGFRPSHFIQRLPRRHLTSNPAPSAIRRPLS